MLKTTSSNQIYRIIDVLFIILLFFSIFFKKNDFIENFHLWFPILVLWNVISISNTDFRITKIELVLLFIIFYFFLQYFFNSPELAYRHQNFFELIGALLFYLRLQKFVHSYGIKVLLWVIIGVSFGQFVFVILEYFDVYKSTNEFFKYTGTFKSPNWLGIFSSLSTIVIIWLLFIQKNVSRKSKYVLYIILITNIITLIISHSRTALLMLIFGILTLYGKQILIFFNKMDKKNKLFSVLSMSVIFLISLFVLFFIKKDSSNGRLLIAKLITPKITESPILGHGFFSFLPDYNHIKSMYFLSQKRSWDEIRIGSFAFDSFNEYIFILYELGIIGFALIILLLVLTIRSNTFKNRYSLLGVSILISSFIGALFFPITSNFYILNCILLALLLISSSFNKIISFNRLLVPRIFLLAICLFSLYSFTAMTNQRVKLKTYQKSPFPERKKIEEEKLKKMYLSEFKNGLNQFHLGSDLVKIGKVEEGLERMEKGLSLNNYSNLTKRFGYENLKYGNIKKAEEIFLFNTGNVPFKYDFKMDLLRFYQKTNNYEKIKSLCNEIIDLPIKIPSKKVDRYKQDCKRILTSLPNQEEYDIEGTLSKNLNIYSGYLRKDCNYKIYLPNVKHMKKKLPVVYLTDGQHYSKSKFLLKKIDSLIEQEIIQPIALVFIDPRDVDDTSINYRQEYFLCNKKYPNFITFELLPEVEKLFSVSNKRNDRTILGHSFGGLFSAYLGYKAPDQFKNIAMQSPAFHPCPDIYKVYRENDKLDLKIYLSYGTGNDTEDQDLLMIKILKKKGYQLKVTRIEGGNHDWDTWMQQIEEIMIYFYGV